MALNEKNFEDSVKIKEAYKNFDTFTDNCIRYLSQSDPGLVAMLKSLTAMKKVFKVQDFTGSYILCMIPVLEQIYAMINSKYVGLMSLA